MYNLLVNTEWNGVYCKYQYERASISSLINETNAGSDSNKFDQIKNYPALFIHEGFEGVSKLGWITKVRDMQGEYQIEYTHECEVDSEKLKKIARDLDIAEFASHRTHWALKEIDLSKLFEKCDILPKESFDSYFHTPSFSRMHFDVAFSFPGEKRDLVEKIVEKIKAKKTYSIFYDRDFEEELAVPGMDLRLINIYKKQAKLVCIFLCPEYEQKKMVPFGMESYQRNN